ncbi:hypothetical protein ACS0TY_033269 [Phlomoides rotata]
MGILHSTCFGCKTEDERSIYPYLKSRLQNRPNRGGHSSSTYYVSCKEPTSSSTGKHALEERTRMKKTDREEEEKKKSCKEVTSSSTGKDSPIKTSREMRWIKHYSNRHRILLVGEGDFSFSASLAVAFASAPNIIATSLNSQEFLKKNYSRAASNIDKLRRRESKVMHEVDATKMANHPSLGQVKFDRIIFNFPYAGLANTIKTLPPESQLRHRRLVDLFLKNAREMISENGEIHISHKTMEFKLETIASSHGLRLIEAVQFNYLDYPGYRTKCGFGGDDDNFNCNPCKTCKFGLKKVHYY